jgi:hypothetical protein
MRELSNIEKKNNEVSIPVGPIYLNGNLDIPEGARGIVVLAYGSGSSMQTQVTSTLHRNFREVISELFYSIS